MWSTGASVKLCMENSQRDNHVSKYQHGLGCLGLSISLFSFGLELSVPVFSEDFLSVGSDDGSGCR